MALLAYLLPCLAARVPITSSRNSSELLDIWQLRTSTSAVDSAADGEHVFSPAYEPREDILIANNMLIEWAVIGSSEAMFQIHRMCFSNRLTIHKVVIKVRHSFVIKNW